MEFSTVINIVQIFVIGLMIHSLIDSRRKRIIDNLRHDKFMQETKELRKRIDRQMNELGGK